MIYWTGKLVWALLDLSTLLPLLAGLALLLGLMGRRRAAAWIGGGVLAAVAGLSVLPLGDWLMAPLENRFPMAPDTPYDGIVVLGGGVVGHLALERGQPQLSASADRLVAGLALLRQNPQARMIYAGGPGSLRHAEEPDADVARQVFTLLGAPQERITYENRSRNTAENARNALAAAAPAAGERWALVTSAWHMPRAIGAFRRQGFAVTAYPVDYATGGRALWLPGLARGVGRTGFALKEWAGLAWYWLTGAGSALLPAP
ncbi:MAG: YdcF family protein [Thalassobaculales bacterium]